MKNLALKGILGHPFWTGVFSAILFVRNGRIPWNPTLKMFAAKQPSTQWKHLEWERAFGASILYWSFQLSHLYKIVALRCSSTKWMPEKAPSTMDIPHQWRAFSGYPFLLGDPICTKSMPKIPSAKWMLHNSPLQNWCSNTIKGVHFVLLQFMPHRELIWYRGIYSLVCVRAIQNVLRHYKAYYIAYIIYHIIQHGISSSISNIYYSNPTNFCIQKDLIYLK